MGSPKNGKGEKAREEKEEAVDHPRARYRAYWDYSSNSAASSPCLADDASARAKGHPEKISRVAAIVDRVTEDTRLPRVNPRGFAVEAGTDLKEPSHPDRFCVNPG